MLGSLFFAGVAGVGKTTVARLLSDWLGMDYFSVEAVGCWGLPAGRVRQECFLREFRKALGRGEGIYDNHLLSVYAYSRAMGVELDSNHLNDDDHVIVLTAFGDALRNRILGRLGNDGLRRSNVVEPDIRLHFRTQRRLLSLASRRPNTVVLDTTGLSPTDVGLMVIHVLTGLRWW